MQALAGSFMSLWFKDATDPDRIKTMITGQLTATVQWRRTMAALRTLAVDALFEVGPGRVLCGLARLNGFGAETPVHAIGTLAAVGRVLAPDKRHAAE